jgi:hypothetical protein
MAAQTSSGQAISDPLTGWAAMESDPPNLSIRLFQFYSNTAHAAILVGQAMYLSPQACPPLEGDRSTQFAIFLFFVQEQRKKAMLKIAGVHLVLFLLFVAPFFSAFLRTADYYGGLTMSYETYLSGFGYQFLIDYYQGEFLDTQHPVPTLTLLRFLGLLFFMFEVLCKKRSNALYLLLLFLSSSFFAIGTCSPFLQKIPLLSLYPFGKSILLVQWTLILAIGYALGKIHASLSSFLAMRNIPNRWMVFFYGTLLLLAYFLQVPMEKPLSFSLTEEHKSTLQSLEKQELPLRVYIHEDMKKSSMLMPELVVLYTKKPTFNTVNGFHETITVPYTWLYTRDLQPTYWLDALFATGYEITYRTTTMRNYTTILSATENYTLYEIPGTSFFDIVQADTVAFLSIKDAIGLMKTWLQSSMPLQKQHIVLIHELGTVKNLTAISLPYYPFSNYLLKNLEKEDDYLFYGNEETGKLLRPIFQWNTTLEQLSTMIPQDTRAGDQCTSTTIQNQTFDGFVYRATIIKKENTSEKNCFLLLRVSMHPDWKATIQKESALHEADIVHLSPSFMGVLLDDLETGTYTVTFTFTGKPLQRVFIFFFLSLSLFVLIFSKIQREKVKAQQETHGK